MELGFVNQKRFLNSKWEIYFTGDNVPLDKDVSLDKRPLIIALIGKGDLGNMRIALKFASLFIQRYSNTPHRFSRCIVQKILPGRRFDHARSLANGQQDDDDTLTRLDDGIKNRLDH
ncbi:hypothetical protein FRC18_001955 [Serendipita sp. 400]|nr:hypothetical protein FRC18_001955 [Serendipita sp. 400]